MPRVRDARDEWRKNPLSVVGRWKLFDNLRRSLTPPALLVFLLLAWTVLPGSPFVWTLIALFVLAFPIYAPAAHGFLFQPPDTVTSSWLRIVWSDVVMHARQIGLSVAFLAHQSVVVLDAIGRTLWRLFVSREDLLEWTTAQQAEESAKEIPASMWASVGWGLVVLASVTLTEPLAWITALPFAAAWIAAPWIARAVSQPIDPDEYTLTGDDRRRLRAVARRTWRFFDEVLTERDRWLPPDNLQVQPAQGLARRTSPTNIGLAVNAVQAARDLGYLPRGEELARLGKMLDSVEGLERYRGHLYNWYDTQTGAVMAPRYVSTVDSGNLAGSLLALKQGVLEVTDELWPGRRVLDGFRDTLGPGRGDGAGRRATRGPPSSACSTSGPRGGSPRGASGSSRSTGWPAASPRRRPTRAPRPATGRPRSPSRPGSTSRRSTPWPRGSATAWASRPASPPSSTPRRRSAASPPASTPRSRTSTPARPAQAAEAARATLDGWFATARDLAERADQIVRDMDFRPLYDAERDLFRIGYDAGMAGRTRTPTTSSRRRPASRRCWPSPRARRRPSTGSTSRARRA